MQMKYNTSYHFNNPYWGHGKFFATENDRKAKFVGEFIQSMIDEIDFLNRELDRVNAENAKDERVAAAEAQAKEDREFASKAFSRLRMGFTKEDEEKVDQWWSDHTADERQKLKEQGRYLGKAAHRVTYKIIPTEIGTVKEVACSCGETLDLTDNMFFG